MGNKTYIGKKIFLGLYGEELISVTTIDNRKFLEEAGFEVEEVDENVVMERMTKIVEEFENE